MNTLLAKTLKRTLNTPSNCVALFCYNADVILNLYNAITIAENTPAVVNVLLFVM